jgi:hypothetical protein
MTGPGAPEWIRLYPVPFRALDNNQRFRKYEPIRVEVETHRGDTRPETRRPNRDSIQVSGPVLTSDHGWRSRRRFVEPLIVESMCELRRMQRSHGTSLGIFRPAEVQDVRIEPADVAVEKQRIAEAWAAQGSLLDAIADRPGERDQQVKALEIMPYAFKYRYRCSDSACGGHEQSIIDWEIAQFYRQVRNASDWQERVRAKWLTVLCGPDKDTAFIVGNQHQHPGSFLVLGVWWPPRQPEQLSLSDLGDA